MRTPTTHPSAPSPALGRDLAPSVSHHDGTRRPWGAGDTDGAGPARPRDTRSSCECGFRSALTTKRMAAYALRVHSCERHRALAASRARGEAQRALRGTVIRECQHDGRHQHGDRNRYVLDQCRCDPCREAAIGYERMRTRQTAYGRWQPYVDAEPARQHVRALMAGGMGWKRIGQVAGVPSGTMTKLLYGDATRDLAPSKRVRPETAQRLLAVTLDHADAAFVPARPTWRRIEGMVALGYPKAWIAEQIGQRRALQLRRDFVLARTERAVADLAERVGDDPGPSDRARRYAAARGWLVPAYGTDEEIAEQKRIAVELAREAKNEIAERRERVQRLLAQGVPAHVVAQRLGITADLVQADRKRPAVRRAS